MPKPLRLGTSGSSFVYVMPRELVMAAYFSPRETRPVPFDDRQNRLMVEFMREMMGAVSASDICSMECYHSTSWDNEPIIDVIRENPEVEVWSVHAPYGRYCDPSAPDEEARRGAEAGYANTVEVARRLGAQVVVAHPGTNSDYTGFDMPRQARLACAVEVIRAAADLAGESGIRIAVEPLPLAEPGNTLDEVLWVVERVDRPNVGINFDVNHLYPPEAIPGLIRRAGELIQSVHISDQDGRERHWLPFQGIMDWQEVLTALVEVGYTGPLVYETHIKEATTCEEVTRLISENYRRLIALAPGS